MSVTFHEITGLTYWASYLINGDASGMEDAELDQCERWLRENSVRHVVSIVDDSERFTNRAGLLCGIGLPFDGADVCEYVCELEPVLKPGKCLLCGERLPAESFPGRHNCGATIYPKSEAR